MGARDHVPAETPDRNGPGFPREYRVRVRRIRASRAGALAAALLLAASCFEPPIMEELEIRFLPQGPAVVTASVTIRDEGEGKKNLLVGERIDEARRDLSEERDFWSRAFGPRKPEAERRIVEKEEGRISRVIHRAYVGDPDGLAPLLEGAAGSVSYSRGEGWAELILRGSPGSRASGAQFRQATASLDLWSERAARYIASVRALYAQIDSDADRALPCFAALFRDVADEETRRLGSETTEAEGRLVEEAQQAMNSLLEMFTPPEDSAWSPDELCRLAHEPFPARVRVRVPGPVLELEAFREDGPKGVSVPDTSLFGALESLEGEWVSPDPFVAYVRHGRTRGGQPLDVASFAKLPRSMPGPSPTSAVVRRAIVSHLTPAAAYRVRWSTADLKDADREIESWDDPLLTD